MSTILDWLTPWWAKAAALAAIVGACWWAVHTYNVKVSAKAVEAALTSERAKTTPIIDDLKLELATIKATSEAEAIKRKAELNLKTKEYQNAIAQNKALKTELDSKRSSDADFERLLNAVNTNNSVNGTGISTRYDRLKTAHQQCERDLREALETTANAIGDISEATAGIDALKLK